MSFCEIGKIAVPEIAVKILPFSKHLDEWNFVGPSLTTTTFLKFLTKSYEQQARKGFFYMTALEIMALKCLFRLLTASMYKVQRQRLEYHGTILDVKETQLNGHFIARMLSLARKGFLICPLHIYPKA